MTSGDEMVEGVAFRGVCPALSLACTAAAFMVDMYSLATFCISTLHAHTHTRASVPCMHTLAQAPAFCIHTCMSIMHAHTCTDASAPCTYTLTHMHQYPCRHSLAYMHRQPACTHLHTCTSTHTHASVPYRHTLTHTHRYPARTHAHVCLLFPEENLQGKRIPIGPPCKPPIGRTVCRGATCCRPLQSCQHGRNLGWRQSGCS